MSIDKVLAANIQRLRKTQALSIDGLSQRSGVSRAMISKIERQESSPTAAVLGKLAAGLGVSLASLLNEAGSSPPLYKKSEQVLWQDPALGYCRRQVSRTEGAELVEITLPTGCQVSYPAWTQQPYRQQLWLISGKIGVTYGSENFQLDEGDCLSFAVDLPVTFRNIAAGETRYLLVITRQ